MDISPKNNWVWWQYLDHRCDPSTVKMQIEKPILDFVLLLLRSSSLSLSRCLLASALASSFFFLLPSPSASEFLLSEREMDSSKNRFALIICFFFCQHFFSLLNSDHCSLLQTQTISVVVFSSLTFSLSLLARSLHLRTSSSSSLLPLPNVCCQKGEMDSSEN